MIQHIIQTSVKITKRLSVTREVSPLTINRLREIRRTARQLGYVLCLPNDYTNEDINIAAVELSGIICKGRE